MLKITVVPYGHLFHFKTLETEAQIRRVCIESSEHKGAHISPTNYNRMLIFNKRQFS